MLDWSEFECKTVWVQQVGRQVCEAHNHVPGYLICVHWIYNVWSQLFFPCWLFSFFHQEKFESFLLLDCFSTRYFHEHKKYSYPAPIIYSSFSHREIVIQLVLVSIEVLDEY